MNSTIRFCVPFPEYSYHFNSVIKINKKKILDTDGNSFTYVYFEIKGSANCQKTSPISCNFNTSFIR